MNKNVLPTAVFVSSMIAGGAVGFTTGMLASEAFTHEAVDPTEEINTLSQQAHDAGRRVIELAGEDSECEETVLSTLIQGNPRDFPTEADSLAILFGSVCVYGDVTVHQQIADEAIPRFAEAKDLRIKLESPKPQVSSEDARQAVITMGFLFGGVTGGAYVGDRLATRVGRKDEDRAEA